MFIIYQTFHAPNRFMFQPYLLKEYTEWMYIISTSHSHLQYILIIIISCDIIIYYSYEIFQVQCHTLLACSTNGWIEMKPADYVSLQSEPILICSVHYEASGCWYFTCFSLSTILWKDSVRQQVFSRMQKLIYIIPLAQGRVQKGGVASPKSDCPIQEPPHYA